MHPDDVPRHRVQFLKLASPVQDLRHQGAGDEDAEVQKPADENERGQVQCHDKPPFAPKAPMACMNGMNTLITNGRWNSSPSGAMTRTYMNTRRRTAGMRRPAWDFSNRIPAPWMKKYRVGRP